MANICKFISIARALDRMRCETMKKYDENKFKLSERLDRVGEKKYNIIAAR